MTSQLAYSERLGRRIRTADAASLGVPTDELVLDALAEFAAAAEAATR